jgi:hypothetical protein
MRPPAPLHLATLAVGIVASLSLTACAPTSRTEPPRGDWEVGAVASVHGTELRYATLVGVVPGEPPATANARLAGFLEEVGPAWHMPETIDVYVFPDRATLRDLTGFDTNGRALLDLDAVISIHAADAHEVAHLLTVPVGRPLRLGGLWLEGIAMYYTWPEVYFDEVTLAQRGLPPRIGAWYGLTVHGNARAARADGELPDLAPLVHGNRSWNALPDALTYPAAGSFVTHLLGAGHTDLARIAAFRAFLDDANRAADAAGVLAAFERHMGLTLTQAETAWHAFLDEWDEAAARP